MIGNALEWYDFVIYGFFAPIIGSLFFPNFEPFAQLLAVWGIFWAGFIVRPLGALFFGYLGDKFSRKYALMLSIFFMVLPTTLIGLLPTYHYIGIASPIILVILRLLQGFAMGGEYTGSIIFLIEHSEPKNRCLWGSFAPFSIVIGVIVGSLTASLITGILSHEHLIHWGWRIPFVISIIGGAVGFYIRKRLSDPKLFIEVKTVKEQAHIAITPIKTILSKHKFSLLMIILLDFIIAIGFYIITIYLPSYFTTYFHYEPGSVFVINTINMMIFSVFIIIGALLADRVGRQWILLIGSVLLIVLSYPLFLLLKENATWTVFLMQCGLVVIYGLYQGVLPIAMAELMPISVRYSGVSFGHNFSMAIFGGSTPFLATWLINTTGNVYSPAFMLVTAAVLSLIGILIQYFRR